MNPFSFFDKIHCINLDSRQDRWKRIQSVFNEYEIENVERFTGVVYSAEGVSKADAGRIGCALSFYRVLKDAQNLELDKILIFEDDCEFFYSKEDNSKFLKSYLEELPEDWDMFYLGCNLITDYYPRPLAKFSNSLFQVLSAYALHSVAFSKKGINKLLSLFENEDDYKNQIFNKWFNMDCFLAQKFQINANCFMGDRLLTTQSPGFSDIEIYETNYTQDFTDRFNYFRGRL